MHKRQPGRPSLKITRRVDERPAGSLTFEVWSPFVASYQPVASVEAGLRRIDQLARLICQMRLRGHQKQDLLADVPDADPNDSAQWAELRSSATTFRSYDTRRNDRPRWVRAIGRLEAAEATCTSVGCAMPVPHAA
ncbi:MAG TPA: hypothetical protein VND19_19845 [Acetobacteraceae bacterium]|nr:hypothetical protein [Acetobacteraceae bacterium]